MGVAGRFPAPLEQARFPMTVAATSVAAKGPWVHRAYTLGRRAHPTVALAFEHFAQGMAGRNAPRVAEDAFLALACDVGASGSWERLQQRYQRPLRAFLRKRGTSSSDARQLLDETWGLLAAPPARGGANTRIGTYDGRGTLYAWLATVVWRLLTDSWRARAGVTDLPESGAIETCPLQNPVHRLAEAETERLLAEALESAWAGLTTRQLQVVVLKYRHQLPQTEIARALRVSPPRVTRLLQSATERLRDAVGTRLRAEGIDVEEGWPALFRTLDTMLSRSDAQLEGQEPEADQ